MALFGESATPPLARSKKRGAHSSNCERALRFFCFGVPPDFVCSEFKLNCFGTKPRPFGQTPKSPIPAPSRPRVPGRFGRENSRDFPDPDWAGIGRISGNCPDSLFSREIPGNREIGDSRLPVPGNRDYRLFDPGSGSGLGPGTPDCAFEWSISYTAAVRAPAESLRSLPSLSSSGRHASNAGRLGGLPFRGEACHVG